MTAEPLRQDVAMPLSRWMMLIALVVAMGYLKVSQQNAIFLSGYAVGERTASVHAKTTDVSWLDVQVTEMASPTHLARIARDRGLNLVAWSTWPKELSVRTSASSQAMARDESDSAHETHSLAYMASLHVDQSPVSPDAAD